MKKILSIVLALFFVHVVTMPSMISLASETKKCPVMGTEMLMPTEIIKSIDNKMHECCILDIAFVHSSVSLRKEHIIVPIFSLDFFTKDNKGKKYSKRFQYIKKYIPDIFLQYKQIIVMRV